MTQTCDISTVGSGWTVYLISTCVTSLSDAALINAGSFSLVARWTPPPPPQTTSSYFRHVRHRAYHQKAGRDRGTHAYTIGQEMAVSRSMVKPPLINVGMMKANLSLKGILNRWHLNCLCWDRSQESATAGNMTGGVAWGGVGGGDFTLVWFSELE